MSAAADDVSIGGYFALERARGPGLSWLDEAVGYRSARSALAAVVRAAQPTAVWVPHFICGTVNEVLRSLDATVHHYALTEALGVPDRVCPAETELLICVDYLGMHAAEVHAAIDRHGPDRVVVDASQALFHGHRPGCTTVYSPRKFLGVPDGGLVRTSRKMAPRLDPVESDSIARSEHLLYRLAGLVEAGYAKFQAAEASLAGCEPEAMSRLTGALLRSIDMEAVAAMRVRNYRHLASSLRAEGFDVPGLRADAVPLCCPVRCDDASRVRRELAARRIFTPTYWPDATIPDDDGVALTMRDRIVYLPCDQRYEPDQLDAVVAAMVDVAARSQRVPGSHG